MTPIFLVLCPRALTATNTSSHMNKIAENLLRCGSPLSRQRMQSSFWLLQFALSRCNVTKMCLCFWRMSGKNDKNQNMMKAVCLLRNFYTQPCSFFSLESVFSPQPWPNLRVVYLALNGRLPPTVFNSRWLKREIQTNRVHLTHLMNLNIWIWLHISKIDSNYIVITW